MGKNNPNDKKYNYMLNNNKDYMNYTALTFGNRKITYEELHESINTYAKILKKKGIREGDVIGVCALNTPESVYLLYALDLIGAVVVGLSPIDTKEKIKHDLEITRPKMVISVDMNYSNFKEYEKALNFSSILYSPLESSSDRKLKIGYKLLQLKNGNYKLSRDANLHHLLKQDYSDIKVTNSPYIQNGLTDIMFTGGSTGVHKGVDLSGDGLNHIVEGMNNIFEARPGMIHLGNIPIGHMVYGRMIMHYTLCNNMELALTLKAFPKDFYEELVRTKANAAVGGPPHWVSLIEKQGDIFVPSKKIVPGSLVNLQYATSGGEAKKMSTDAAINAALKLGGSSAKLGDGLGATETWSSIMINNAKKHTPGTLGEALPNLDIKLINPDTGLDVNPGEAGILYVSGPSVMLGYHNNLEETNKVISYDNEGKKWCNLGDYIKQIDTGEYKYVGRQKRNFVSGIDNIYPEQIENLVVTLPEVREVIVTPISDEIVQNIPRYHISIYDENFDHEEFEKNLREIVETNLGTSFLPGYIKYYTEPLVRMTNSKIDVNYYKNEDIKDINNGTLNNDDIKIKKLRKKLLKNQ